METNNFIISLCTSAAVTAVLNFTFQAIIKSKIDYYFKSSLEKYKSNLNIVVDNAEKRTTRRMEAYPLIVEQIYRARNMARDLASHFSTGNFSLFEEFNLRTKQLEDYLYKYRLDLERDNLFPEVHSYKNLLLSFSMKLSDIKYYIENKDESEFFVKSKDELLNLYDTINTKYPTITHNLSVFEDNND